jgi:allantoinase
MAQNPARHFRIDHEKGALTPGRDADIMVLTPEPYVVDTAKSGNSVAGWSPFDGMTLPYKVAATYVRGRLAYDGTRVLAQPGSGRFLRPPERILVADAHA